ncbi:acyl-CoA thioester hydrolase [Devosia subaequoris]|uniref:Acyl-CoA thioester hydrolase n=1 Tax=Devosia subaequoris TaxID=395930 RepID=A0A7W6IPH2_9HYPH|nr:tol-pal system-associated acyl-CoA thioesterase [Devosia subaequoris]MBB4052851.1 acyl-CoA thioester hydrolase [Devosia subaequoris]MCP1210002.1 tol-pal system-associated acyl-CoA thioesterase [Devosia subaequoris]
MSTHRIPVRIYYEDTDFSGNVYHAAYLKFFERGRTELLRDLGVHHVELAEQGVAFAVRSMEIEFLAAARIDDLLTVTTEVADTGGVRLVLDQTILRDDKVITSARVTVVAIKMSGGPARLPAHLRARLVPGA